jgi:PAS domain-containing protein
VDNIPQPIWIKDLDLKFMYVNEEYENIYKGRNKKFIGLKDEEIFDEEVNNDCYGYCNSVINSLESRTEECYVGGIHKKITIVPLINEDGQVLPGFIDLDIINQKDKIMKTRNALKVVMETLYGFIS